MNTLRIKTYNTDINKILLDCIRQHLACDSLTVISGATPPAALFDVLQNYFSYTYNVNW